MVEALRIIENEHRAIAALFHCLNSVLNDIEEGRTAPDFELFHAVAEYLDSFLYLFHHPKEDGYLFLFLSERHPAARALLLELADEHRTGDRLVAELKQALGDYEAQGRAGLANFRKAVDAYHAFEWNHMNREEKEIFPLARQYLTTADWVSINTAFSDHKDPLFGDEPKRAFQALYSAITRLAPPPHGLGGGKPSGDRKARKWW